MDMAGRATTTERGLGRLLGRATAVVQAMAQPSLAQLALRLGLAVPFWRSGVNKWDGFAQLNDVAVLLSTSGFKFNLPGDPIPIRRRQRRPSPPGRPRSCCPSCSSSGSAHGSRRWRSWR
jgi:hypothetical protein